MEPSQSPQTPITVPIAIIAGFAMIAVAIFFTSGRQTPLAEQPASSDSTEEIASNGTPRPVDESDYIRGNPNAQILMIEYSDYDCPFCKQYHETMGQIMDEYGVTGRVAWVYRQFPLPQLHPNSPRISEAALCVGDIGGQDAFWSFSDLVFEERELADPTNVTLLPEYAEESGVSRDQYMECMESGRMREAVTASAEEAFRLGARGTPYTVLVVGNQQAVITGAQPYDTVKRIIENLLSQLDGTFDPSQAESSVIN